MGRPATTARVLLGMVWVPIIQGSNGRYRCLQIVLGHLAAPILVAFFFGVLMKRMNPKGDMAAVIVGFAVGLFRPIVDALPALHLTG